MKIYSYKNYDDYVAAQTEANRAKLDHVFVEIGTIRKIAKKVPHAKSILCHGTRNGAEQMYFLQCFPNAEILGTEISDTATTFARTLHWDFQNPRDEWSHRWDIVYSNSFDHALDPLRTLQTWRDQISTVGKLFIEHSPHVKSRRWDPLEISNLELNQLFKQSQLEIQSSWAGRNFKDDKKTIIYELRKNTS